MIHPDQSAFRALADPTRREILRILMDRDQTITEVAERFEITRPAVKKHLKVLEDGALITVTARGRERINHLNPEGFRPVLDWLGFFDRFWTGHLADLKSAIEKDTDQ